MPIYNCKWHWNLNQFGFSEEHHINKANVADAETEARDLHVARMGLIGKGPVFQGITISDITIEGDAKLVLEGLRQFNPNAPVHDNLPSCWSLRTESANQFRRTLFMQGAPDDWLAYGQGNGIPVIPAQMNLQVQRFRQALIRSDFGILAMSRNPAVAPERAVIGMAVDTVTGELELEVTAHGLSVGDEVNVRKFSQSLFKGLKGRYYVKRVRDVDHYTINVDPTGWTLNDYQGGALAKEVVWEVQEYNEVGMGVPTIKKPGTAFFLSAGT